MTWRYRQFVQGVLFDDHDKESTVESSDEEFVPPAMEEPERSYKRRLSAKEVNDVRFVIVLFRCHVGPQRSASAGAHSLARVCTVADAQPDAAAADADVDATSGTEDAVHVLRAAAAAAVSPLLARRLPPQLSRSPASAPADTADTASRAIAAQSPADGPLLQQLAALPLFDARAVAAQLPRAVDFAAVSRACDLIDQLVAKLPPSPPSTKKADFV